MANDFQFYLLTPLFIVAYQFKKVLGYIICGVLIAGCIGLNYAESYLYRSSPFGVAVGGQSAGYCTEPPWWFSGRIF